MFAVIKTGGKQYKVASGDVLKVEKLAADAGETVQFNEILMLSGDNTTVGSPFVDGAAVQAEVVEQGRGPKLVNFKKRRRKHSSKRLKGHRQHLTEVKITEILASGGDATGVKAALGAASAGAIAAAVPATEAKKPVKTKSEEKAAKVEVAAEQEPAKDKEPAEKTAAAASAEDAAEVKAVQPGNLLDAAQGEADDLTQISGVGPKLNTKLNENGVYHFWQIAQWGPEEIAWMDDKLSFKGRIERDGWIDQAEKMSADKSKSK
ncbi:MAG: 50S ribosomal protein L21 [Pseudomonadota bacterium]